MLSLPETHSRRIVLVKTLDVGRFVTDTSSASLSLKLQRSVVEALAPVHADSPGARDTAPPFTSTTASNPCSASRPLSCAIGR